jgi:hypothetical protein
MSIPAPDLAAQLQVHLPPIFNQLARQINIAHITAQLGSVGHVTIGQVTVGNVTVGTLTLNNTTATLESANAYLQNVGMNLELQFTLNWSYNVGFWSGSGSDGLGSLWFSMNLGNVAVPSLGNIKLTIPEVSLKNMAVAVPPMSNLDLGGATFSGLNVTNTTAPTPGFTANCITLGAMTLAQLGMPAAACQQVTIDDFKPAQPITLPAATVGQISVPTTTVPNISSGSFAFDAQASSRGINADFGIFSIGISVTPIAHMSIGAMQLGNVNLSATVGGATINNIQVPIDVHNILLNTLKLNNVSIDTVKV